MDRPTGDDALDTLRRALPGAPTTPATFAVRAALYDSWLHLIQRLGVDTGMTVAVVDAVEQAFAAGDAAAQCAALDRGFILLEDLWRERPAFAVEPGALPPAAGDGDWPGYGGDVGHHACTAAPGPRQGRVAWSAPAGLAWYARPALAGGRLYACVPGMRTLACCREAGDGTLRWRSERQRTGLKLGSGRVMPQSYSSPALASTPVVLDDVLIGAELGAQGRDQGARDLVWFDRASGAVLRRVPAGQADYRMGHAALAGDARHLVTVEGTQRLQARPPQVGPPDHVVVRASDDGRELWRLRIGPCFNEPVLDAARIYLGTADGMLFALNRDGASAEDGFGISDPRRIAWSLACGGAVNGAVALVGDAVVAGSDDGCVQCVDAVCGMLRWRVRVSEAEPRTCQLFSPAAAGPDRLYLATARRELLCLDLADGAVRWRAALPHWGRARPALVGGRILAGTLDGSWTCVDGAGRQLWQVRPGRHEILADPVVGDGLVYSTDARLLLRALDPADAAVRWARPLLAHAVVDGRAVPSEEMGCGGWYQSKPTAAEGTVYCGTPSRFVLALDADSGAERWRCELGGAVSGAPTLAGDLLLIGQQGGDERFFALERADGRPRWTQTLGWVWSSATVAEGRAFIPCVDGHFACLDVARGHVLWRRRSGAGAYPEPPVADGRVFFGSWDHFIYCLDPASGRQHWAWHTGGTPDSGAPIASGGRLYVPMGGRRVACLDAASGQRRWLHQVAEGCMNGSPALSPQGLMISTSVRPGAIPAESRIRCLDPETGRERWSVPGGGITAPVVAGGLLYAPSTSSNLVRAYDLTAPTTPPPCRFEVALGDRVYESVPAIHRGRLFILCEDGFLHAIA
jgi:outer membrane protein assembly factor BamB